jgi:1-acyl-sn-glycerol-3-phosphate acyltransferase
MPHQLTREPLIDAITAFLAGRDPGTVSELRDLLEREIDTAGADAITTLGTRLATAGADWAYYASDPLARRLHHALADRILLADSALHGAPHIAAIAGQPVVIFANHLSYADANLVEILLCRFGQTALADRLTVIAGPKVYSSLKRRFSSLCFGTIKTPQSSGLSTGDAVMNPREVARAARRSIDIAHERLRLGDALLLFAEGTRSRSGGMQQMLTAATRYLDVPGVLILPVGITGTEALFPIGDDTVHGVTVTVSIGTPLRAEMLHDEARGDRSKMMNIVGRAIAAQLPSAYRGVYAG